MKWARTFVTDAPSKASAAERSWRDGARQAWRAYAADRLAVVGLAIVVIVGLIAIFAPWISPYSPTAGVGADLANLAADVATASLDPRRREKM